MRTGERLVVGVTSVGCALLIAAPAAWGVARFASPAGSGTACTQASPCDVGTAINSAGANDDVTVEPGTYGPSPAIPALRVTASGVAIHGQVGAPRPLIMEAGSPTTVLTLQGSNSSVSDIEFDYSNPNSFGVVVIGAGDTMDRVVAHSSGTNTAGMFPAAACIAENGSTVTNSLCVVDGPNAAALYDQESTVGTITLRNDTFENSGAGGVAVFADGVTGAKTTIDLSNSIAHGTMDDLLARTDTNPGSSATITADHSNYANAQTMTGAGGGTTSVTAAGSGTNQAAAPMFVNGGQDDFHELAGSPTLRAGVASAANGMFDLDGNPRQFGGAPDIGAYQFVPPPTCQAASASTAYGVPASVQLQCADAVGAPLTFAIVANPGRGSVSVNASTGVATYTPGPGYSGPDSFTFRASSSHGTSAAATATITVGSAPTKPIAPRDSQPVLSLATFAAMSHGGSIAAVKGTTISYTDSETAATIFTVLRSAGKGVVSKGKCVKRSRKGRSRGKSCTRFKTIGSFSHADVAGLNRFRFTGRVAGHKLKPGRYQLLSYPRNAAGLVGPTHTNIFKIVR